MYFSAVPSHYPRPTHLPHTHVYRITANNTFVSANPLPETYDTHWLNSHILTRHFLTPLQLSLTHFQHYLEPPFATTSPKHPSQLYVKVLEVVIHQESQLNIAPGLFVYSTSVGHQCHQGHRAIVSGGRQFERCLSCSTCSTFLS